MPIDFLNNPVTEREFLDVFLKLRRGSIITAEGCCMWMGHVSTGGYGSTKFRGRSISAHLLSYNVSIGPVLGGLELDHLCRNRRCWNPDHLEPVTHLVNVRRGLMGRQREKTHCIHGHLLNGENLLIRSNGTRACKTCRLTRLRAYNRQQYLKHRYNYARTSLSPVF